MNQRVFPVQDSTLSAEALAERVLKRYDLAGAVVCRFFRKGICDTYKVETSDQAYYLKVYKHGRRTRTDVTEEVRLLNHLAANGVSVAKPVMRQDGHYVSQLAAPEGTRYAVLFEAAHGVAGHEGNRSRIEAFGEMVGRMHRAADQMREPYRRSHLDMRHLVDDNLPAIASLMAHRGPDFSLIGRIAEECRHRISQLLPKSKPEYGICHGDLHGGDVCYGENHTPVLFDFDSSGYGWRALDIGVFLASDEWMDITGEAEDRRQRQLAAFVDGYSSIRTLSEHELAAVQLAPPIRHIFLMGFVLRYTATWEGAHWANDDFIDWHMTWFRHWAERNL
ncbi:MAG: phosphotransferase [Anaerolineae bacterium]|nr:phosphotransferase [Anaerolineae bacterium]